VGSTRQVDDIFSNVTCIEFIEGLNAFVSRQLSSRYFMHCKSAAEIPVSHCSLRAIHTLV